MSNYKRRDLLTDYNELITKMMNITPSLANLERNNNFSATSIIMRELRDARNMFKDYEAKIKMVRKEIKSRPKRKIKNNNLPISFQKGGRAPKKIREASYVSGGKNNKSIIQ